MAKKRAKESRERTSNRAEDPFLSHFQRKNNKTFCFEIFFTPPSPLNFYGILCMFLFQHYIDQLQYYYYPSPWNFLILFFSSFLFFLPHSKVSYYVYASVLYAILFCEGHFLLCYYCCCCCRRRCSRRRRRHHQLINLIFIQTVHKM